MPLGRVAAGLEGAHHQHRGVDLGREDHGVGDEAGGRAVDDHAVEALAQGQQQLGERGAVHEVGGIGRDWPRAHHPQVFGRTRLHRLVQVLEVEQRAGQAFLVFGLEDLVNARAPQVGVDQAHALPGLRHGNGNAAGDGRLAFRGAGAGHQEHPVGVVGRAEHQVGAHRARGLGDRALWV
jgi:hypothetical protein